MDTRQSSSPVSAVVDTNAESRLRRALNAAGIGVWEFDPATGDLQWDARVREVVEAEPDITPTWVDHFLPAIHPEDLDAVQAAFAATIEDGTPVAIDFRVVGARTGRVTWAHLTGAVEQTASGPRLVGTARDITDERVRYAEALADRRIWADIVETDENPVVAVNTDLVYIALNKAYVDACEQLFDRRFRIGERVVDVLAHMPWARDGAISFWSRALSGRTFQVRTGSVETRLYENLFRPMRDSGGVIVGAYHTSRDITARAVAEASLKTTSEALQRAQKMESIGNLTGGIAHDFNNLLQVVSGNLQLLQPMVAGDAKAERRIANALMGVDRGAKLASQLLAFGRRQPLEPKVTHIGRLIAGMDDLLRGALGEETEVSTSVAPDLWNTFVDPARVENALLNLAINGRDAMEGRGKLDIEAANATLDERYAGAWDEVKAGDYVLIAVTDTGSGMTPEVIERVFEPFFSTKPEGHGTGLGLSMVHGFVKQSAGHVEIDSEIGRGTTVKLYLPRALGENDTPDERQMAETSRGDAAVLVVEDDDQVRDTAAALLQDLGYSVLRAADAASAMDLVNSDAVIDLIFTDIVMPGEMRSIDMVERARATRPGVAVLFTSGYTRNAVVHGGRLDAGVELLTKPYTQDALGAKVAEVLRRR